MGMDLIRDDDRVYINYYFWGRLCAFAIEGGWNPMGTLPPESYTEEEKANWSGTYFVNYYQIIASEDALSMAFALEKMLLTLGEEVERADSGTSLCGGIDDQPRDVFIIKENREMLEEWINFLKGGACAIG